MQTIKQQILSQARQNGAQVTALREQVLDIVLARPGGVIKAYNVLSQMQQQSEGPVAPPTAYRALDFWAEQGVLLLNTVLTVRAGQAHSHAAFGWETFTDCVIRRLAEQREGLVFILWGSHAQKKGAFIDRNRHLVLSAPHPSPLSAHRGFFGSRPFSQTNAYLKAQGKSEIDWQV